MDMTLKAEDLRKWVPSWISNRAGDPLVEWCFAGDTRFTGPFFDDTVGFLMQKPFNRLFRHRTPIEFLREVATDVGIIPPTGFIFHMSRCGSTLVSQMLAASGRNIVMSEPPPVDSILRANIFNPSLTDDQRKDWFRWIVAALGRKRSDQEERFFIKFDSWSALEIDLVLATFPGTPWVFLYRDPVEVMVSQMKRRGAQMIPGALDMPLPGLEFHEAINMAPEEYCARVIEKICASALQHAGGPNGLFVNYSRLPEAVTSSIARHFSLDLSSGELDLMAKASGHNAKNPSLSFSPDSEEKRKTASPAVLKAVDNWLAAVFEQMEAASA